MHLSWGLDQANEFGDTWRAPGSIILDTFILSSGLRRRYSYRGRYDVEIRALILAAAGQK